MVYLPGAGQAAQVELISHLCRAKSGNWGTAASDNKQWTLVPRPPHHGAQDGLIECKSCGERREGRVTVTIAGEAEAVTNLLHQACWHRWPGSWRQNAGRGFEQLGSALEVSHPQPGRSKRPAC